MKRSSSALSPDQLRKALFSLSARQAELRDLLAAYRLTTGKSLSLIQRESGVKWTSLKDFEEGRLCLSGGKGLTGLCKLLGREHLSSEIAQLARAVGDRYLALATGSREAIETAVELIKLQRKYSSDCTVEELATIFGEQCEVVRGILNGSRSAVAELGEDKALTSVQNLLTSNLDGLIQGVRKQRSDAQKAAAEVLNNLLTPLAERFGGPVALAKALDVSRSSLYYAQRGQSSVEQIEKIIAQAQKLSRPHSRANPAPTPSEPEPVAQPPQASLSVISDKWATIGGATTEEGVRFVLTEESFLELDDVPLVALRDAMLRALPVARMLLNIGSQCKDRRAREILQEALGPEVQELQTAIRLFTFAHPNRLLEMYDSQRQGWAAVSRSKPMSRKGR